MIAFTTAIMDPEAYRRYARPGIARAAEPDSVVRALAATPSVARSANLLLDDAARLPGLEALVIVDQTAEITDPACCAKLRAALADPGVAVVGAAGARGVRSIAWWDGEVSAGPVRLRHDEHGGGELAAFGFADPGPAPQEVEAVGGFLLGLSPWAVQTLRFDETLHLGYGYDVDFCARARAEGRSVVTADVGVTLHRALDLVTEEQAQAWIEAHIALAARSAAEPSEAAWRARARRAEAERDAARTLAYSNRLRVDAHALELEAELEAATATPGWRLTTPLRRLNALRRRR